MLTRVVSHVSSSELRHGSLRSHTRRLWIPADGAAGGGGRVHLCRCVEGGAAVAEAQRRASLWGEAEYRRRGRSVCAERSDLASAAGNCRRHAGSKGALHT